jgi:hypothetical protein
MFTAPGGAPPELEESDAGVFAGGILVVMVDLRGLFV